MKEKTEKIFNRCLGLIEKGYSMEYCLKKYCKYKSELQEYFNTIEYLNNLKKVEPEGLDMAVRLDEIYNSDENITEPAIDKAKATPEGRRSSFLKPTMVFISVLAVIIFSFAGTLYASQDSIPGEDLYPIKRVGENVQLFLWPESRKGELHFKFLNNRIYEAETLMEFEANGNSELMGELITEIDVEYYKCKEYNFFKNKNEEEIAGTINKIKNRYRNQYRQDSQDTEESDAYSESSQNGNDNNQENNHGDKANQNRKR